MTILLRHQNQLRGTDSNVCILEFGIAGGTLTIDHFQPRAKADSNEPENLIYACITCNQYKQDYWPSTEKASKLWNPRQESPSQHFVEQEGGQLSALTATGIFTIKRLRLNRSQLIAARQRRQQQSQVERLLQHYRELTTLQTQITTQLSDLSREQQALLKEQRQWLRTLLSRLNQ